MCIPQQQQRLPIVHAEAPYLRCLQAPGQSGRRGCASGAFEQAMGAAVLVAGAAPAHDASLALLADGLAMPGRLLDARFVCAGAGVNSSLRGRTRNIRQSLRATVTQRL